jgi:twitching motility protein PilT
LVELHELLQYLQEMRGSDLHVRVGAVPHVRIDGHLQKAPFDAPSAADLEVMAKSLLPADRAAELEATGETDFAHSVSGEGRYRIDVYRQRGSVGMVIRRVVPGIPDVDALGLPMAVEKLAEEQQGLILVTGTTGSGKTTTVAAMLDRINETRAAHIITIEDPIEVLHADKQSIVSQREVGTDTPSFAHAMERALRQDPDVIFVGELRDAETVSAAITAAETGNLVISTMRTIGASETLLRLLDFFPHAQHRQMRQTVAGVLRGIISQRLLERADGKGRTPAVEVLVNTAKVFDCIVDPDRHVDLERVISEGDYYGMQTFDQALFHLYKDGLISLRDALAVAARPEDFRIQLQQAGLSGGF